MSKLTTIQPLAPPRATQKSHLTGFDKTQVKHSCASWLATGHSRTSNVDPFPIESSTLLPAVTTSSEGN